MSCDHELANEWARCSGKNASYLTSVLGASKDVKLGKVRSESFGGTFLGY